MHAAPTEYRIEDDSCHLQFSEASKQQREEAASTIESDGQCHHDSWKLEVWLSRQGPMRLEVEQEHGTSGWDWELAFSNWGGSRGGSLEVLN